MLCEKRLGKFNRMMNAASPLPTVNAYIAKFASSPNPEILVSPSPGVIFARSAAVFAMGIIARDSIPSQLLEISRAGYRCICTHIDTTVGIVFRFGLCELLTRRLRHLFFGDQRARVMLPTRFR